MPRTAGLPDILISASAGTGKTFRLVNRFLQLLLAGAVPDSVLAATFTRKAAGEIFDRILKSLATAAVDEQKRTELAGHLGIAELTRERCVELLSSLTQRLHRLQVGTLDSFFARLAGGFSLDLGWPPDWHIVDDLEYKRSKLQAIDALLHSQSSDEMAQILRWLTKGDAARSVMPRLLDTVEDAYDVFLETTPDAWHRVPCPALPTSAELLDTVTWMRSLELPKHKSIANAHQKAIAIAESGQWSDLLSSGIANALNEGETTYYKKPIEGDVLDVYSRVIEHIRAFELNELARQTAATWEFLSRFDRHFRELRRQHGGWSFTDIPRAIREMQRATNSPGDGGSPTRNVAMQNRCAFRLDHRAAHVLLDEFQDTSPLQWDVVRPFIRPSATSGEGNTVGVPPSFFCVGDVKQAIYRWRGGDARLFAALPSELPGLTEEPLNESRRSAPPIIDAVNQVFGNLQQHDNLKDYAAAVQSWCSKFPKHSTAKPTLPGYVELSVAPAAEESRDQWQVTLSHAADLVTRIAQASPRRTIGVLTRTNETVAQLIGELQSRGIRAGEEGGRPLTDAASVLLILSLLRLIDHPGDTAAQFHVATSPLGSALKFTTFRDQAAANALANHLRLELLTQGYGECIADWARVLSSTCTPRERRRLDQLVQLAAAFQADATLRTRDFVTLVREQRVPDPTADRVSVMTVHQAKGLEFDCVVLPDLDTGLLKKPPTLVSGNSEAGSTSVVPDTVCLYRSEAIRRLLPAELQQIFDQDFEQRIHGELCVLYVALTRAIHALHLVISPSKSSEQSLPKSLAGLLRAALANGKLATPETILYQHGDPDWANHVVEKSTEAPASSPQRPLREDQVIGFAPPLPEPLRGWQRDAPSRRELSASRCLNELLRSPNAAARERGTVIHKWFEQIEWLDDGVPTNEQLLAAAQTLGPLSIDPASLLGNFAVMLSRPEVSRVLRRDAARATSQSPRVLREHSFACRVDGVLLSGSVDRLTLWTAGTRVVAADIVDFKTDAVADDPAELTTKVATYRPQLAAYRQVIAAQFGVAESVVSARLVFAETGDVVDV